MEVQAVIIISIREIIKEVENSILVWTHARLDCKSHHNTLFKTVKLGKRSHTRTEHVTIGEPYRNKFTSSSKIHKVRDVNIFVFNLQLIVYIRVTSLW